MCLLIYSQGFIVDVQAESHEVNGDGNVVFNAKKQLRILTQVQAAICYFDFMIKAGVGGRKADGYRHCANNALIVVSVKTLSEYTTFQFSSRLLHSVPTYINVYHSASSFSFPTGYPYFQPLLLSNSLKN